jgi:hypothetical protein
LSGCETETGMDRNFGEAIEILFEFGRLRELPFGECVG